jgi:ABC-2 type transport system ATP-binding protein
MEDIERLCPRIVILREGRVVHDGRLDQVVQAYADHKVLTVHLRRTDAPGEPFDPASLGQVLEATDLVVRVRVPRPRVAEAAGTLLRRLPVADLAIEEPDVGTIIEGIQRAKAPVP